MALSSYSELQTAVASWLNRDDLTATIPTFIALADATIQRRVRGYVTHDAIDLDDETVSLPSACAALRSISLTGTFAGPLRVGTPEMVYEARQPYPSGSVPRIVAVLPGPATGGTLLVGPVPDTTYSADITYLTAHTPLSDTAPANELLYRAPDIYLYGTLVHSAPFLADDERIPVWERAFEKAIEEWNLAREREEFGASLRPLRLARTFG